MKEKLVQAYMKTAEIFAELSHARRLHVGCIIVKDDRIISIGYNGMPAGWENNCEDVIQYSDDTTALKTKPEVLHAETNAIAKLARSTESGVGADLFVTHSPCLDCAKLIYQSGISRVWYGTNYRDSQGVEFLRKSGVEVTYNASVVKSVDTSDLKSDSIMECQFDSGHSHQNLIKE